MNVLEHWDILVFALPAVYAAVTLCMMLDVRGQLVFSEQRIRTALGGSGLDTVFIDAGQIFRNIGHTVAWRHLPFDQQHLCEQIKQRFQQYYSVDGITPLIAANDRGNRRALCTHFRTVLRSLRESVNLYKDLELSGGDSDTASVVVTRLCESADAFFQSIDALERKQRINAAARVRARLAEKSPFQLPRALAVLADNVRSECASWKPQSTEDAYTQKCIDSYVATTVQAYGEAALSDRQAAESLASDQLTQILNAVVQRKVVTNDDAFAKLRANGYFLGERFGGSEVGRGRSTAPE